MWIAITDDDAIASMSYETLKLPLTKLPNICGMKLSLNSMN